MGSGASSTWRKSSKASRPHTAVEKPQVVDTPNVVSQLGGQDSFGVLTRLASITGTHIEPPFVPSPEFPSVAILTAEQLRYAKCNIPLRQDAAGIPEPQPHVFDRDALFDNAVLEDMDFHAASTPSSYHRLTDVLPHLTSMCSNDRDKLRSIFMWVANLDLPDEQDEQPQEGTIKYYAAKSRHDQPNFIGLFEATCRAAGLECSTIHGFAKGASFRTDNKRSMKSNHAWSAVLVEGRWYLSDVVWSRKTDSTPSSCRDFYLMPRPEEFIYSHLPADERWQLLARPVSRDEFYSMVYVRKFMFTNGIRILNQHRLEIPCSGETSMQFSYGGDKLFLSKMQPVDVTTSGKTRLDGFVTLEAFSGSLSVRIEPPATGCYRVEIFCQNVDDLRYSLFVVYIVRCTQTKQCVLENPPNSRHLWGPSSDTSKAGLDPSTHTKGVIQCSNGVVEVVFRNATFKTQQSTSNDGKLLMSAELTGSGTDAPSLKGLAMVFTKRNLVIINAKLPSMGKFSLILLVLGSDNTYIKACVYLIVCTRAHPDPRPFPQVQQLGLTKLGECKLRPISHIAWYFDADSTGTEVMEFELKDPDETGNLLTNMWYHNNEEPVAEQVLIRTSNEYWLEVSLRFPYVGTFTLEIMEVREEGQSLLISYIIEVTLPSHVFSPFFRLLDSWHNDYQVLSPTELWLLENTSVHFMLRVGEASDVFVDVGTRLIPLYMEGDQWVNSIDTGPGGNLICVCKCRDDAVLENLVSFQVLSAGELKLLATQAEQEVQRAIAQMHETSLRSDIADALLRDRSKKFQHVTAMKDHRRLMVDSVVKKVELEQKRREQEIQIAEQKESARNMQERNEKIAKAKMNLEQVTAALKIIETKEALKRSSLFSGDVIEEEETLSVSSEVNIPRDINKKRTVLQSHIPPMSTEASSHLHKLMAESDVNQSIDARTEEYRQARKAERELRPVLSKRRLCKAIQIVMSQRRVARQNLSLISESRPRLRARAMHTLAREKLQLATLMQSKSMIFDAMKSFLQNNAQAVNEEIFHKARRMIQMLNRREALLQAMRSQSVELLRKALGAAQDADFEEAFPLEKLQAKSALEIIRRRTVTQTSLMELDKSAVAEIVNFLKPSTIVHDAVAAALMLVGVPQQATRDWGYCKEVLRTLGMKTLIKQMCELDLSTVSCIVAQAAYTVVEKNSIAHVADISLAAASMHAWALDISKHILASQPETFTEVNPPNHGMQEGH